MTGATALLKNTPGAPPYSPAFTAGVFFITMFFITIGGP